MARSSAKRGQLSNPLLDMRTKFGSDGCAVESSRQGLHGDEPVTHGFLGKKDVLFTTGDQFGEDEVVSLQAPTCRAARVVVANGHEPVLPSRGERRGRLAHPL